MDPLVLVLWLLRLLFLALLYAFLLAVARILLRDLRAAAREPTSALGRLLVLSSTGDPPAGAVIAIDATTTFGRDVNNTVVLDDPYVSGEHAVLTYRGRAWHIEDLGSTNGTFVNGEIVAAVDALGFGDVLTLGGVQLRLERPGR